MSDTPPAAQYAPPAYALPPPPPPPQAGAGGSAPATAGTGPEKPASFNLDPSTLLSKIHIF